MAFEELGDWEVSAMRDGALLFVSLVRQSYPEEAVLLLMAVADAKFDVKATEWEKWRFWCVRLGEGRETALLAVNHEGLPVRLGEALSDRGSALQQ